MDELREVAVIGGLGKMGRGIALLVLIEQTWLAVSERKLFNLKVIDVNLEEARAIRDYFRRHLKVAAEKGIIKLREAFKNNPNLISNEQMIEAFVEKGLDSLEISSDLGAAKKATLIFEAAFEEVDFKVKLLKQLKEQGLKEARFFTNTSSIPIHVLNEKAGLDRRIIGFHFYNPPVVQQLMEIIPLESGEAKLTELAVALAKKFKKIPIMAKDVAGFIGNGHFIREIALGFELAETLKAKQGEEKALYTVDRITKSWLIRPMGLFQLLDYVGLDVCAKIAKVMSEYGRQKYRFEWLERFIKSGLKGGQNPDGSQRKGIFAYEKGEPVQIYSLQEGRYVALPDLAFLGERPSNLTWKALQKNPHPQVEIKNYFNELFKKESIGASTSKYWLEKSDEFMQELVQAKVAADLQAVSEVIKRGFFHLYTPNEVRHELSLIS